MVERTWFAAVLLVGYGLEAEIVTTGPQAEAVWRRELLPLQQELSVRQVRRLKPGEVAIRGRTDLPALSVRHAAGRQASLVAHSRVAGRYG